MAAPQDTSIPEFLQFRLEDPQDPFTEDYWLPPRDGASTQLARSAGYQRLWNAIERYTMWASAGRSFLISGNRGVGKTTLVESAIEDVRRTFLADDAGRRPLFVRVHGPDLFPRNVTAPVHTPVSPVPVIAVQMQASAAASSPEPVKATGLDRDPLLEHVLKQIVIALYRAAANEYVVSYRERIRRRTPPLTEWQETEFYEAAAQFAHDIEESPQLDELTAYWDRIGLLRVGVLFPKPEAKKPDQGMLEVVTLSMAAQAYRVISGTWEDKRTDEQSAAQSQEQKFAAAGEVKNLLAPFVALLSGGAVVAEIGGVAGVVLGLLSALVISMTFSFSSSRTRDRKKTSSSTYAKDRTVSSLGRTLPQLVTQFRRTGLHPVFVVDELDKVKDLPKKMRLLISYLKDFASDRALFCFLTDRDYLEYIERRTGNNTYAPEYSYFRERIPVFYQPEDLRRYLMTIFRGGYGTASQSGGPLADYELLAYSLLHRARLHPLDLGRELANLGGSGRTVKISLPELREGPRMFELVLQLAVEKVLASPDLQDGIRGSARFAQLVLDALYYPSRSWARGDDVLLTSDLAMTNYLEDRMNPAKDDDEDVAVAPKDGDPAAGEPEADANHPPGHEALSARDRRILLRVIRRVVYELEDPADLVTQIKRIRKDESQPSDALLEMVPTSDRFKLLKKLQTDQYKWRFNAYGQLQEAADVDDVIARTEEDRNLIERAEAQVQLWTEKSLGLGALAAQIGLPGVTPQWSSVRTSMDRVGRLERTDPGSRTPYQELADDANRIAEYAAVLKSRGESVAQALCCISALSVGSMQPVTGDRMFQALQALATEVNLKGTSDDVVGRIGAMYRTLRELVPALDEHLSRLDEGVQEWITQTSTVIVTARNLPLPDMRAREWQLWRDRFNRYFVQQTAVFESSFLDVWTRIDSAPPFPWDKPGDLRVKLAEVTLSAWTSMLLRASRPNPDLPFWLSIPAASVIGLTLPLPAAPPPPLPVPLLPGGGNLNEPPPLAEWARAAKNKTSPRQISLLIRQEQPGLTAGWTPSTGNSVFCVTMAELAEFTQVLHQRGVTRPIDIGLDQLLVELAGNANSLAQMLKNPPAVNLTVGNSPPTPQALPLFNALLTLRCTYILPERPGEMPESGQMWPYVVAPAGVDDLFNKLSTISGIGSKSSPSPKS